MIASMNTNMDMTIRKRPLTKPDRISNRPKPYENTFVGFHWLTTAAKRPITKAEQSNSMCTPSEIRPKPKFLINLINKANISSIDRRDLLFEMTP